MIVRKNCHFYDFNIHIHISLLRTIAVSSQSERRRVSVPDPCDNPDLDGDNSNNLVGINSSKISGTDSDDTVVGGSDNDHNLGFGGSDEIHGCQGYDIIIVARLKLIHI